ncbi:hypothetical protein A0J61_03152 [Choanephora cucurbitarum]|uniref:RING-type domain-containing protein n=1 Tax=Choanephora cucurbitarum TaxID=101091 RepID=A0A1C7NJY2_9FUNG|nr:hypothetical protein A0J61_03152 [Choanephora cucurbitarum]
MTGSESSVLERQLAVVNQLKQRCRRLLQTNHPASADYTCTICLDMLQEPVTLSCDHTFCRACLQRYFCKPCERKRPSESFFSSARRTVYCECYALDAWDRKAACPLCRHPFATSTCRFDADLSRYLALYFPSKEEDETEPKETFYNRIQRWSYRIMQQESIEVDLLEVQNSMNLMTRRSWII